MDPLAAKLTLVFYKECGQLAAQEACLQGSGETPDWKPLSWQEGCDSGRVTFPGSLRDRELLLAWAGDQMLPQNPAALWGSLKAHTNLRESMQWASSAAAGIAQCSLCTESGIPAAVSGTIPANLKNSPRRPPLYHHACLVEDTGLREAKRLAQITEQHRREDPGQDI